MAECIAPHPESHERDMLAPLRTGNPASWRCQKCGTWIPYVSFGGGSFPSSIYSQVDLDFLLATQHSNDVVDLFVLASMINATVTALKLAGWDVLVDEETHGGHLVQCSKALKEPK